MKVFVFLFAFLSFFQAHSEDLQSRIQQAEGKTFSAMGPNCFATALKVGGILSSYRGVDAKEFEVIQKNFCQRVDQPLAGDIGVFETPRFGFVHAYVYVAPGWGLQKPGVDYNGKTPISMQSFESINYAYLASPECRRYSKNIADCSNLHYYIRCQSFSAQLQALDPNLETEVRNIETAMGQLLDAEPWTAEQKQQALQIQRRVLDLSVQVNTTAMGVNPTPAQNYILARQISLEKQAQFLAQKAQ